MTSLLPTLIYEPDAKNRAHILSLLSGCAEKCDGQFPILLSTGKIGEAMRCAGGQSGILLVIVGVVDAERDGKQSFELEQLLIERNRDTYTLYWVHLPEDLAKIAGGCFRPSGFIVPTRQDEQFEALVSRIYGDYTRLKETPDVSFLTIQSGGKVSRLSYGEILYIEASDKKLNIWTKRQCLSVYERMSELEQKLGTQFIRCHRSYLVNYSQIESVNFAEMEIILRNSERLPLSRTCKNVLKERLAKGEMDHGS